MGLVEFERERGVGKISHVYPRESQGTNLDLSGVGVKALEVPTASFKKLERKLRSRPNSLLHEIVEQFAGQPLSVVRAIYRFEKNKHAFGEGLTVPQNMGYSSRASILGTVEARGPYSPSIIAAK